MSGNPGQKNEKADTMNVGLEYGQMRRRVQFALVLLYLATAPAPVAAGTWFRNFGGAWSLLNVPSLLHPEITRLTGNGSRRTSCYVDLCFHGNSGG